jgi:hypothetical protein
MQSQDNTTSEAGAPRVADFVAALADGESFELAIERYLTIRDEWRERGRAKVEWQSGVWRYIRAVAIFAIILEAVLVYNPEFTIAGIWNHWQRGGYVVRDRNAISVLVLGFALVGCAESLRRKL